VADAFRLRHLCIDTLREHVVMIHESAVRAGDLGFHPLDRVRVVGDAPDGAPQPEITGVLNFCRNSLLAADEIGLSDLAFADLGLPEGAPVSVATSTLLSSSGLDAPNVPATPRRVPALVTSHPRPRHAT
jgi:hypothetical protein